MSTLLKAVTSSETILMVSQDPILPVANAVVLIGTEQIAYETNYNGTLYGCTRGYAGTSAASHLVSVSVTLYSYFADDSGESKTFKSLGVTDLTASKAVVTDASKVLASSSTTSTELGYVAGVTSAIQTQLNTKAPKASPVFTGSFTLPTLTTTQRDALTATKGMLIYNSSDDVLNYYDGAWKVVAVV